MKNLKDSNEPLPEKVILPDECGDSLWEEILEQNDDRLKTKITDKKEVQHKKPDKKIEKKISSLSFHNWR